MGGEFPHYDLLIVGGGINGAGIARDAAGRGLSVLLVEKDDLAAATSSWSSKLIHGGLRYLEQYEFRLVAEALSEREVLLNIAPHLVESLSFVMPHVPELRPRWMIRAGLYLYDHLGRRTRLPGSRGINLRTSIYGAGLKPGFSHGFIYSDCRVDDARLVVANALSAQEHGARILTRTECLFAKRSDKSWQVRLSAANGLQSSITASAVINAAGPWVKQVLNDRFRQPSKDKIKLVKGSHLVVPRLYEGAHAFILQNEDRRVIFMIPYEEHYTLIGTTDVAVEDNPGIPSASADEIDYLCRAVNRYLLRPIKPSDAVWTYAGIRPLYDDGSANPSAVTRDYTLRLDTDAGDAPILSVYGGKITTYRKLAEHALDKLAPWFSGLRSSWTAQTPLFGGDMPEGGFAQFTDVQMKRDFSWLPDDLRRALARRHGTNAYRLLEGATAIPDLGKHFGSDLYAREVDFMIEREWALSGDDILFRRTKAGLHLSPEQKEILALHVTKQAGVRH